MLNILKGTEPGVTAGLDVGGARIKVVVPRFRKTVLAGAGDSEAMGIAGGKVCDEKGAARSLAEALAKAEQAARLKIKKVFLGISPAEAEFLPVHARAAFKKRRVIRKKDLDTLLRAGGVPLPAGHQVVQVFPREFSGPGHFAFRSPAGIEGEYLEWRGMAVTVQKSLVDRLTSLLNELGIGVAGIALNVAAAAGAVLGEVEKQVGAAVFDLGSQTTGFALFKNGVLWEAGVLPVGSAHITADLAIGLGTSLAAAESLKRRTGLCGGDDEREAVFIVRARVEETLSLLKERIGTRTAFPCGIVLTGGGALLKGLPELTAEFFGVPVRVGAPRGCVFPAGFSPDPAWCASVGLIQQN